MKNLKNVRFGRLLALKPAEKRNGKSCWSCLCDCGNITIVYQYKLLNGETKSCGCLRREKFTRTTHGQRYTKLYKIWESMKRRCDSPRCDRYKSYGGRGIKYIPEWKNFEPFFEWAKSSGYQDGLSIDRIDPNGDYKPKNCRWIPLSEQAFNKTNSLIFTYDGETKCLSEWAEITGIPYERLYQRIRKLGQTFERAIEKR